MTCIEIKSDVISVDLEIVSGAPCFVGTRVPVRSLFDYLEGEHPINDFLDDFPSVNREQVHQILRDASQALQEVADKPYQNQK